ncbi:geranylgeranyl pyrophosphate synthetase [Colletotrichum navitas]|uniref:Geranylgeranyl pyrophosphate synthetase n=1 Tax=Colletotrichum navitas TaxID=681940 RepID=A0AAD8UVX2_9PEZI|nr:geranylgeranyl pyrophosphate synthetase [Colletotrichum navitas]KAK1566192.1 geranylgeranyl pyrophosphate synthetase [Colletotrichum navitas]
MYRQNKYNQFQSKSRWRKPEPETPSAAPPFGSLVETVDIAELSVTAGQFEASAQVTSCELVASYNWLDKTAPSVLIPGAPPRWTPIAKPRPLAEDSGVYYRDKNAARYPAHPMEPTALAVLTMHPEPFKKPVDIVGCGSTIGNLLRFVRGDERPFRMLVEVVGGAVHLIRRENSPTETIPSVRGYGHTFPEAYTTWDAGVRGSASHQRVLRYDFGGLSCVVRHEGDGYLADKLGSLLDGGGAVASEKWSVDSLIQGLDASEMESKSPSHSSPLSSQPGGFQVPQAAVFDLKTRSMLRKGKDFLAEELPRLWVAQIPNFILAYHQRGTFTEIEVMDVSEKVKVWEKSMQRELSQLAALLHRIVGLAHTSRDGRLEVIRQEASTLQVREQCPELPLAFSADMMAKWEDWLASDAKSKVSGAERRADDLEREAEDDFAWAVGDDDYTACSEKCSYCGKCTY